MAASLNKLKIDKSTDRADKNIGDCSVDRNVYQYFCSIFSGAAIRGIPRRRWEVNIKMDLRDVGWGWTGLIWFRISRNNGLLFTR